MLQGIGSSNACVVAVRLRAYSIGPCSCVRMEARLRASDALNSYKINLSKVFDLEPISYTRQSRAT